MSTFNHGRYQAVVTLVGGYGFAMSWQVEWFDERTSKVSYWYGTRDECLAEAKRDKPNNPEWVDLPGWNGDDFYGLSPETVLGEGGCYPA